MAEIEGVQITSVDGFAFSDDGETAAVSLKLDVKRPLRLLRFLRSS